LAAGRYPGVAKSVTNLNRGSGGRGNGDWCLTPAARWHLWKISQGEAGFSAQITPSSPPAWGQDDWKEEGADRRIRNNSGIAQITGTFSNKALAIALSAGQGQGKAVHMFPSLSSVRRSVT